MKDACFMCKQTEAPCFIQLGRFGDLILLFPAFKAIHDRTGHKPVVIVSTEYANLFDGITYAEAMPVHWHWWKGIPDARQLAQEQFGGAIIPQWWHSQPKDNLVDQQHQGATVLQCHGNEWGVNIDRWPNFMTSMWERAGFTVEEMKSLPVVFDRRSVERESTLLSKLRGPRDAGKPLLLLNWFGYSSPFGPVPEYMRVVNRYADRFKIVDLSRVKAVRLYDLLGLFDAAAGLLTIDTATLHLAGAGNVEYIAFTRSDWSSSVPKGRCVKEIKYNGAEAHAESIVPILEQWAGAAVPKAELAGGGGGGVLAV